MQKSQLRRLARDYSMGKVDVREYRQRRRALIDGIVDGHIAIERETYDDSKTDFAVDRVPQVRRRRPAARSVSPVSVVVGVVVLALGLGLGWMILDRTAGSPAPRAAAVAPPAPAKMPAPPTARTLVERFVAVRDWSAASVGRFRSEWASLSEKERREARGAPWFRRLTKAIGDELKTQKALLEFDKTGKARETGRRILDLAEFVGVETPLPGFPAREEPLPTHQSATPPPSPGASAAPTASVTALPPRETAPSSTTTQPAQATFRPSAPEWLAALEPDRYTLQLFALSRLDQAAALRARYGSLDLRILDLPTTSPRYRVLLGNYATEAEARAAHAGLPASLRDAQPRPYIKTAGELQALTSRPRADTGPGSAPGPAGAGVLAAAPRDEPPYTLQVFASSNKDNVDRLVQSHPALGLEVRITGSETARYRVVYGRFDSEQQAETAADSLPSAVTRATGRPIVKSLAELRAVAP